MRLPTPFLGETADADADAVVEVAIVWSHGTPPWGCMSVETIDIFELLTSLYHTPTVPFYDTFLGVLFTGISTAVE
jgi:hypothetical protein